MNAVKIMKFLDPRNQGTIQKLFDKCRTEAVESCMKTTVDTSKRDFELAIDFFIEKLTKEFGDLL